MSEVARIMSLTKHSKTIGTHIVVTPNEPPLAFANCFFPLTQRVTKMERKTALGLFSSIHAMYGGDHYGTYGFLRKAEIVIKIV